MSRRASLPGATTCDKHARALAQLSGVRIVAASDPFLKEPPKLPAQEESVRLYAGHPQLHGEVVGDMLDEDRYFLRVLRGQAPIRI